MTQDLRDAPTRFISIAGDAMKTIFVVRAWEGKWRIVNQLTGTSLKRPYIRLTWALDRAAKLNRAYQEKMCQKPQK